MASDVCPELARMTDLAELAEVGLELLPLDWARVPNVAPQRHIDSAQISRVPNFILTRFIGTRYQVGTGVASHAGRVKHIGT